MNSRTSSGLSHIGIGLLLIGVASSLASTTDTVQVPVGVVTPVEPGNGVAGYGVRFDGVELVEGGGVQQATARIAVDRRQLRPSLVSFVANGATSVETATDRGWRTDIQVSLIDADANRAIVRISRHPGMSLIWLGAAMMTLGLAIGATLPSTRPRTAEHERLATKVDS